MAKYETLAEYEAVITEFKKIGVTVPADIMTEYEEKKREKLAREAARISETQIYSTLVAHYPYGKMPQEKKDCIENTVRLLMEDGPNSNEPGLLLGMIQCGKTDTFENIIGLAFDKGIDVCIALTKNSKPLAEQTKKRMVNDYRFFKDNGDLNRKDIIYVCDILDVWKNLSQEIVDRCKIVIVCKKQHTNMSHLISMFEKYCTFLLRKKVLIVDDEADFASRNYINIKPEPKYDAEGRPVEQERESDLAKVSRQIDDFRKKLEYCRYLQVTATPYCLYLQPEGTLNLNDKIVMPFRPRFTTIVPTHPFYIGGREYFELSENEDSMYSHLYQAIDQKCIDVLRHEDKRYLNTATASVNIYGLTRAMLAYIMATAIRTIQERETNNKKYESSALIHVEIDKDNHDWQRRIIQRLIDSITNVIVNNDTTDLRIYSAINELYTDFDESNRKGRAERLLRVEMPPKEIVLNEMAKILSQKYYCINVVNSDEQINSLLDSETGELSLSNTANIFIGGNVLDRGITIKNMLCFFYGRNPKTFKQDTVMQHARMYGARSKEDMAVTRLHTTNRIYSVMKRMNDNDNQLREWFISGKDVEYDNAVFQAFDKEMKPCDTQKIKVSDVLTVKGHKRVLPLGMWTKSKAETEKTIEEIDNLIAQSLNNTTPDTNGIWETDYNTAMTILLKIESTYIYDSKYNNLEQKNDMKEVMGALQYCCGYSNNKVYIIHRVEREISRINSYGGWINSPEGSSDEINLARQKAIEAPVLTLLRQNGKKKKSVDGETNLGWNNAPFYWPVILTQKDLKQAMYAIDQRKKTKTIPTDYSDILEGIDPKDVLDMTYDETTSQPLLVNFGQEGTIHEPDFDGNYDVIETRSIKKGPSAAKFVLRDEKGNFVRNPDVPFDTEHDHGVYSFNNGMFPYLLRPYKYMLLRSKRNSTADIMLLKLADPKDWRMMVCSTLDENGDLIDRDNPKKILVHGSDVLRGKDLSETAIKDETIVQWQVDYAIAEVLKYRKNQPIEEESTIEVEVEEETEVEVANIADNSSEITEKSEASEASNSTNCGRRRVSSLKVTLPNGRVIKEKNATATYCAAIKAMGLERINKLQMIRRGVNIISTVEYKRLQLTKVGRFFIFTNLSTADKKKILDDIAFWLKEDIVVEVIDDND